MSARLTNSYAAWMALLIAMVWAISHSYRGLVHDARLYTLQALARLDSGSLAQDVFLRFGSQDQFTVFSPIYAGAINLLGVDHAAALLTFASQIAVLLGAWMLARTAIPFGQGLLGLAIVTAMPGTYGAARVFSCIEAFVTPRMVAEALVLAGIAAMLSSRNIAALALIFVGALLHPIMAAAGLTAAAYWYLAVPHPRIGWMLTTVTLVLFVAYAVLMPSESWGRFDPAWLSLVDHRSPYLFLSHWSLDDWSRLLISLTTLLTGSLVIPVSRARSLCQIALMVTSSGIVVTLVGCDVCHLVFLTQLQPWRWQWLGTIVAALALPMIVGILWRSGLLYRAAALSLCCSWIFESDKPACMACAAAIACVLMANKIRVNHAKIILIGAWCLVALALTWRVATNLQFTEAHDIDASLPLSIRRLISFCHDGTAPVLAIICAWRLLHINRAAGRLTIGCMALATAVLMAPTVAQQWTRSDFSRPVIGRYAAWREKIPAGAQVYWPQSPINAWTLLDRPNYFSPVQSAGALFSREAAMELQIRAKTLSNFVPTQSTMGWDSGEIGSNSASQLQDLCSLGVFDFLITATGLHLTPVDIQPGRLATDPKALKLYRCTPQARAAAAAT